MNISTSTPPDVLARVFHLLGQPARLQILLAIGDQTTCVCHLEACLGYRQAYISQQLMLFRDAGLLDTYRQGKHIYYNIVNPGLLEVIELAGKTIGLSKEEMAKWMPGRPVPGCTCPHCSSSSILGERVTPDRSLYSPAG